MALIQQLPSIRTEMQYYIATGLAHTFDYFERNDNPAVKGRDPVSALLISVRYESRR